MNDLWIITHEHRHGISAYLLRSDHEPSTDEVVRALDLDYEPHRPEESIEIIQVEESDIKQLPAQQVK